MYCRYNDACYVGDKLYASACNVNGLFSIDIKTYEIKYIMSFPQDPFLSFNLHSKIICIDNTLFCIPLNGAGISVINLQNYSVTFVASKVKFVNAIIYKNSIYLIPYQLNNGIWKYLINENTLVKTNLKVLTKEVFAHKNATTDWYGSLVINDFLYIVVNGTGKIIKINLMTGENQLIQFKGVSFANIAFVENWFYITDNQYPCIYKTMLEKTDLIKIVIPEGKQSRAIYRVVEYNNSIVCIPCFGDFIYQYDVCNNSFQVLHAIENNKFVDNNQTKYAGTVMAEGKLILLPKGDLRIIELDMEAVTVYKSCMDSFPDINNKYNDGIIVRESRGLDLIDFMKLI